MAFASRAMQPPSSRQSRRIVVAQDFPCRLPSDQFAVQVGPGKHFLQGLFRIARYAVIHCRECVELLPEIIRGFERFHSKLVQIILVLG